MSRLTETVVRLGQKIHHSNFFGDLIAGLAGFAFFSFTVGVKKLDPQNVGWLGYDDQVMHWVGWLSFASDQWRWPLGSNPNLGWERMNSIVFTDSWPGLAVIFKALHIDAIASGQYFGFGFLLGAIALFVGGRRLFRGLGCSVTASLIASGILGTTAIFWWMQRWYSALSAGLPLLVWAIHLYLDNRRGAKKYLFRWSMLTVIALATHAYLLILVMPFLLGVLINRFLTRQSSLVATALHFVVVCGINVAAAYVLGYFTIPSKWAQTGGYGWYSANLLWPIDPNGASRLVPNFPSLSGQYEPTALGAGALLLLVASVAHPRYRPRAADLRMSLRSHAPLICMLTCFVMLGVSNTVSFGEWSVRIPMPLRVESALSIFRSSARFVWPILLLIIIWLILHIVRHCRMASMLLVTALLLQCFDSGTAMEYVRKLPDGSISAVSFDEGFWASIPKEYEIIASHPAQNTGLEWAECMYAAVRTARIGQCGFFARVQGLENVNRVQSDVLFSGEPEPHTIYWISVEWLRANRTKLQAAYPEERTDVLVVHGSGALAASEALIIPNCGESQRCSLLGKTAVPLGKYVRDL